MEKLKQRWGINSNLQIIAILIVFAINGSFAAWVTKPAVEFVGLSAETSPAWIFWPARILLIFAIYQTTLPLVGFCFGQFTFFWNFTKRILAKVGFGWLFKEG
ncbi:MAG: diacylglyceryl transferase [Lutibacter sp.]|jgi:hypothetical protein|nr:diacylglyceryl transferase [Lutibacter sp.]